MKCGWVGFSVWYYVARLLGAADGKAVHGVLAADGCY